MVAADVATISLKGRCSGFIYRSVFHDKRQSRVPINHDQHALRQLIDRTLVAAGAEATRRTILLIEDTAMIRKMFSRLLSNLGYEVVTAENGVEGLAALREASYFAVFCDVMMPIMVIMFSLWRKRLTWMLILQDGFECVEQFRKWEAEFRPSTRQHIVCFTAQPTDSVHETSKIVGMDHLMSKQVKKAVIVEHLLTLL